MDIKDKFLLYERTVNRLEQMGISNPLGQIMQLAAEIEEYRAEIHELRNEILRLIAKSAMEE